VAVIPSATGPGDDEFPVGIVAGAAGGAVFLTLLVVLIVFLVCRARGRKTNDQQVAVVRNDVPMEMPTGLGKDTMMVTKATVKSEYGQLWRNDSDGGFASARSDYTFLPDSSKTGSVRAAPDAPPYSHMPSVSSSNTNYSNVPSQPQPDYESGKLE
jgi:hypothetical protein